MLSSYNAQNPLLPLDSTLAKQEYEESLAHLKKKKITEALRTLRTAHKADPSNAQILNKLVEVTEQKNDLPTAEKALISALVRAPGKSRTWEKLGRIYAKQGQKSYAVACLANA